MNIKIVVLGLIVAMLGVVVLGSAAVSNIYADSPWGRGGCGGDYEGHGIMGRGMMGHWGRGDETCPLLDDSEGTLWDSSPRSDAQPLNLEDVEGVVRDFLADQDANLELAEVMEFSNHFYAEAVEKDTGIGAYELLIDRYTGKVYPEMGPNMMWNEKYGMMGGGRHGMMGSWWRESDPDPTKMAVSPAEAVEIAQDYLERNEAGLTPDDEVTTFYGYYTLHTLRDGEITGMLSVNGDSGRVWYHTWHDDFVRMTGGHHEAAPGHDEEKARES